MDRKNDHIGQNGGNRVIPASPTIYPVILAVPEHDRRLTGRKKVAALSRHARRALALSSQKIDRPLAEFPKNDAGAPLPVSGIYWSLSHKTDYVAAVAAPEPVGIDIEQQKPRSTALIKRIATEEEWALGPMESPSRDTDLFFRFWTAKEAVLKAVGVGIKGLSKCHITKIIDHDRLMVDYEGTHWHVAHVRWEDHIVSVTQGKMQINWTLP